MNDRITGSHEQIMAGEGSSPKPGGESGVTPHPPEALRQGITDQPISPAPAVDAAPSRNRIQWVVAVILLAVLVFGAVFAVNYLPYVSFTRNDQNVDDPHLQQQVTFFVKVGPGANASLVPPVEDEIGTPSYHDFWFVNDNDTKMVIGLKALGCTCSSVDAYLLPEERRQAAEIVSALASCPAGPLAVCAAVRIGGHLPWADLPATELLRKENRIEIPARGVGWLRLRWKGEKAGLQPLKAEVWMNDPDRGPSVMLEAGVFHHEPLRTAYQVNVGTLTDEQLQKPVSHDLYVWSSTRPTFRLEAKYVSPHSGGAEADPFEVGTPEPLTPAEMETLYRRNNPKGQPPGESWGRVLSGYKVKLTFRATSRDNKVPFDVGAFRRNVLLSSPDVDGDPKRISIQGRVAGLVDLVVSEEGDQTINFSSFPRRSGAVASPVLLRSTVAGLRLEKDDKRTSAFLEVTLEEPKDVSGSTKYWTLKASVRPNKVSGTFPRAEDPLYEDSAIYLIAKVPNREDRRIRIAVRGMSNES